MADNSTEKPEATAPIANTEEASAPESKVGDKPELAVKDEKKALAEAPETETKDSDEPKVPEVSDNSAEGANDKTEGAEKTTTAGDDTEMKDAADTAVGDADADTTAAASAQTPAGKGKNRRKSTTGEAKAKSLNRKGSKARLTHIDAQPGDHFLVKLKGFPAWPAIICDEDMLPLALINSRPVSAARPDGAYTEAYADGGKRVHDRSFPVMYLYTNEFGWVANTALTELNAEKARDSITEKTRKDLKGAFELATEQHPVEYYKEILEGFAQELIAQEEAKKEAAATPKKAKKGKAKAVEEDEDVEMEMEDADEAPKSKSKKRKAEEEINTPQRSDSVKKPKIKLNTSSTPKAANGTATPKAKDTSAIKATKIKAKKGKDDAEKKVEAPKEPKLTAEERHDRKKREVLYLRHKLQRGLLTREQQPREDEMESMSSFITILENFHDLEVSIIRGTKINKVLKAILKIEAIPREADFDFKKRSQALLDKWNKLLASDQPANASANGVNGASESKDLGKHSSVNDDIDGAKEIEADKTATEDSEDTPAKAKNEKPKPTVEVLEKDKEKEKVDGDKAPTAEAVEAAA